QLSILSLAAKAVAPGGTLVYAVCSLEPEENEGVADRFLGGHTDFTLSAPAARLPEPARDMESPDGFFRARPHVHGTDGFFVAVFTRRP
ncbi:MAG: RsmB/NOP family class I SAM-dependent RNA methyltransferase, partial [Proteobacteria bacterium]|nr:RsmB/NOP family class I SAM-dependent RNA methyltransferase [Pseudomonadota bacterium]